MKILYSFYHSNLFAKLLFQISFSYNLNLQVLICLICLLGALSRVINLSFIRGYTVLPQLLLMMLMAE